jgi:D-amino-acid oxidase
MLRYMPWLRSQAAAAGVRFVERRVRSIDELLGEGWRTVVDCAGVGARELASDPLVKPMHGQVVHVPNDIGLAYSLHDDAQKPGSQGKVAYIFVFRDRLVLGGTFEAGREDAQSDDAAVDGILNRCRELLRIDGHPRWDDLGRSGDGEVRVGVRPTRGPADAFEWTRVEREERDDGRTVVHNYGHGRSGASFSWATAEDVARLLREPRLNP